MSNLHTMGHSKILLEAEGRTWEFQVKLANLNNQQNHIYNWFIIILYCS